MKKHAYIFLLLSLLVAISCQRRGCTDPLANNYEKSAVKADDDECEYGEIIEPPCGDDIEFCADYGADKLLGAVNLSEPFSGATQFTWKDSTGNETRQFDLIIYGNDPGTYTFNTNQEDGTFDAFFANTISGQESAISGSMEIVDFSLTNGVTAEFFVTMSDSTKVTNGNLFRAK